MMQHRGLERVLPRDESVGTGSLAASAAARDGVRRRPLGTVDSGPLQQIDLEPLAELLAWAKPRRLRLAIFAAAMMTFVFDQVASRQANLTGATHPLPRHRLVDLVRTLASHLLDRPARSNRLSRPLWPK